MWDFRRGVSIQQQELLDETGSLGDSMNATGRASS
jgi:hypothetical protein